MRQLVCPSQTGWRNASQRSLCLRTHDDRWHFPGPQAELPLTSSPSHLRPVVEQAREQGVAISSFADYLTARHTNCHRENREKPAQHNESFL
jgi:hypothetical protein